MSKAELYNLRLLTPGEQMLVYLRVLGLADFKEQLSPLGRKVQGVIMGRVNSMGPGAIKAINGLRDELYPRQIVEKNGTEYAYYQLEVKWTTPDGIIYELYGYRVDDDTWRLIRSQRAEEE